MRLAIVTLRSRNALNRMYSWLRHVSGDAAYENYLRSIARGAGAEHSAPLGPTQFYLEQLQRRFSRPNRCC